MRRQRLDERPLHEQLAGRQAVGESVQQQHHTRDQAEVARDLAHRRLGDQRVGVHHLVAAAEECEDEGGQRRRLLVAYLEAGTAGRSRGARNVASEPTRQHLRHGGSEAGRQLLGEPEVEEADHGAGQHQEVPRVRIALEEAVLEDHAGVGAADALRDDVQVVSGGSQRVRVDHLDAVEELEDQQPARGVLGMQARHAHRRIVGEPRTDALGRLRLALEVELERHQLGDLVHDAAHVEALQQPARQADHGAQAPQVDACEACHLGILHLHHDGRPVAQGGAVHLRQRGGGQWLGGDVREHGFERTAELALDPSPRLGERTRRDGVMEAPELADERGGEDVGSRPHDLAELHEEAGQMDAQVVQALRRTLVDALPGLRRGRAAEALAQGEPAVGDDGRRSDEGDAQHPVDGELAEHGHAASRSRRGNEATGARRRRPTRTGRAASATTMAIPAAATTPSQPNPSATD
jgi:hypothetical protein